MQSAGLGLLVVADVDNQHVEFHAAEHAIAHTQSRGEFFASALALNHRDRAVQRGTATIGSCRRTDRPSSLHQVVPRCVHVDVARCSLEALGIAGGGNDVSSLRAGAAGGLEADSGAGVSVRAARFSSGIWSARVDGRTLLNRGIAPARAAGIRSASGSLFTGLGAAPRPQRSGCRGRGIWLSISELCTGCLQLPSGAEYEARSA